MRFFRLLTLVLYDHSTDSLFVASAPLVQTCLRSSVSAWRICVSELSFVDGIIYAPRLLIARVENVLEFYRSTPLRFGRARERGWLGGKKSVEKWQISAITFAKWYSISSFSNIPCGNLSQMKRTQRFVSKLTMAMVQIDAKICMERVYNYGKWQIYTYESIESILHSVIIYCCFHLVV